MAESNYHIIHNHVAPAVTDPQPVRCAVCSMLILPDEQTIKGTLVTAHRSCRLRQRGPAPGSIRVRARMDFKRYSERGSVLAQRNGAIAL